jgi:hypothetical protein
VQQSCCTPCSEGQRPPETVASGQARPVAIAVDDAQVYWASLADGTIMKRAK